MCSRRMCTNPAAVLRQFPAAAWQYFVLLLRYDAKFEQVLLPITLGTQFDIDTDRFAGAGGFSRGKICVGF